PVPYCPLRIPARPAIWQMETSMTFRLSVFPFRPCFMAMLALSCISAAAQPVTTEAIAAEIARVLPLEEPYAYHERLSTSPVHTPRRNPDARPTAAELALPAQGWRLLGPATDSPVVQGALRDFQDYL